MLMVDMTRMYSLSGLKPSDFRRKLEIADETRFCKKNVCTNSIWLGGRKAAKTASQGTADLIASDSSHRVMCCGGRFWFGSIASKRLGVESSIA